MGAHWRLTPADEKRIQRLHAEGWTVKALAEKYNVGLNTVHRGLARLKAKGAKVEPEQADDAIGQQLAPHELALFRLLMSQVEVFACADCRKPVVGLLNVPAVMCAACKTVYEA